MTFHIARTLIATERKDVADTRTTEAGGPNACFDSDQDFGAPSCMNGFAFANAGCVSQSAMMRLTVGMSATSILNTRTTAMMLANRISAIVTEAP